MNQSIIQIFTKGYVYLRSTRPMSATEAEKASKAMKDQGIPNIIVPLE